MEKKIFLTLLSILMLGAINVSYTHASEILGSLSVGLQTGMEGVIKAAPSVSPAAGTYTSTQSVSLTASGSSAICYTTNSTTPSCATATTCTTGTKYSSAISVSSTTTIKSAGCYADLTTGPVATSTYTISSGGGGGGGGGGGTTLPSTPVTETPVTTTTTTTTTTTLPSTASTVAVAIQDPAKFDELLSSFNLTSKPADFAKYKPLVKSDALAFKVGLTDSQLTSITNFVTYGASPATIKLGSGERRAVIRDYLETVGRSEVIWEDVQRMSTGQKLVNRNLAKEQAQVDRVLINFKKMVGHTPNFKVLEEDIAWNTMMYRIRFPRDLVKEQTGIVKFKKLYSRIPSTPMEWSIVRALGYALK